MYVLRINLDTVCPWCYIGHKRLSTAIKAHLVKNPSDTFTTRWLPYQLNPYFPRGQSFDKREYYASKFGDSQAQMIFARLTAAGQDAGINFRFGGNTGNTCDSHRLIEFARHKEQEADKSNLNGVQTKLVEELFADYFEREQDITSHEVLTKAAVRAGLSGEEVKNVLASTQFSHVVDQEVKQAQDDGISGVPHFTLQGQYEISGGQEPAAFLQVFERIKQKDKTPINGNS